MAKKDAPRKRAKLAEENPHIFNMLRPVGDIDAFIEWAKKVNAGENPSPNTFLLSREDFRKQWEAFEAALEDGKTPPSIAPLYQPLWIQHAVATNARVVRAGQTSKHTTKPKDWSDAWGEWTKGRYISKPGDGRRCHNPDARTMVTKRDENVLALLGADFVIGTTDTPAIMLINASETGNFGNNITAGKDASLSECKGIRNLVGRFNPRIKKENIDDGTKPGGLVVWGENQVVDWGYLMRKGEQMTPAQIRKAVEADDLSGIEFKELEAPIVGKSLTKDQFWTAVKRAMSLAGTRDDNEKTDLDRFEKRKARSGRKTETEVRSFGNFKTQCRVNFNQVFPFGLYNSQTGIVPVIHFGDDETELVRFVIGVRQGSAFSENKWQARRRHRKTAVVKPSAKAAKPQKAAKAAPKPKAAKTTKKAKSAPKPKIKKGSAVPLSIVTPEPAPPVRELDAPMEETQAEIDARLAAAGEDAADLVETES